MLNKIKSSPQDLESKGTEPADKKEENDDERPQGKCSRACDCVSLAMARLTVRIFGSVKPQSLPKSRRRRRRTFINLLRNFIATKNAYLSPHPSPLPEGEGIILSIVKNI